MMKKRITAFLIMLVMLMTSISVTYAENAEETAPVAETPIEILDTDEFHALYAMGFVGDELLNTDKNTLVTRAQFTGWLFKLSGYTLTEYKASEIPFRDVSIVTPYYNEICTMYQMGIVNGTDPEMFSPDNHVTYAQACKLIIDVLGYRNYAEIKYGEFPEGYVMMAGELDINDGVKNVVWNSELTAEDAVRMLYNGGMTSIVSFSGVDKFGNPTYKTDDKTLFEKNDIYYKEGQMQSSGVCSIKAEEAVEGITIIDDIRYVSADCDLTDLVGCKVKYFYRDDKASQKLLYAMADKRFSDILELKANELAITSSAYSLNNIVYYKSNGETEDAKINKFAFVIYNNSRIGIPTVEDLKIKTGSMRLVDNNDDEVYDIVIIEEYQNMFVRQVSSDNNTIVGKYSKTLDLDSYENVTIISDGKEITKTDIGSNVLVSYIENREKTKITMYVVSDMHRGTIKSSRVSRGRTVLSIDEGEYRLSNTYIKLQNDSAVYVISPAIGKEYIYYFDIAGEIAEIQEAEETMQYALLMSVRPGEVYEDGDAYTRLLMPDNRKVSGVIKKKVTVNGDRKTAAEFLADTRLKDLEGEFKVQIVQVAFNEEGILSKIDFATDSTAKDANGNKFFPYGYDPTSFSFDYSDSGASIRSQDGYLLCNNKYLFGDETIVFVKWDDSEEAEPYEVKDKNIITVGTYYKEIYDATETYVVGAAYRTGLNRKSYWMGDSCMLVSEIDYVYENDAEVMRISGYMNGGYTSVTEYEPGAVDINVKRGDLIRISHQNSKITRIIKEVSAEDFKNKTSKATINTQGVVPDFTAERAALFAPLYSVSNYGMTVLAPPEWTQKLGATMTSGRGSGIIPVTIYDVGNDEMYIGDIYDIYQLYEPNSNGALPEEEDRVMVYLRMRYMTMKEVIVVRY